MTTFAELVEDVNTLTNRADLVKETELAIRAATLKAHQKDFFFKDLYETGIKFLTSDYLQTFEYRRFNPLWRAFKYLRKSDDNDFQGPFLKLITPDEVVDSYSINKEDTCYIAGLELKIRSSTQENKYLLGCYVHPKVIKEDYDSWVADEYPLAIIYEAAATVFKSIGQDDKTAIFRNMVQEQYDTLIKNNIVANGY